MKNKIIVSFVALPLLIAIFSLVGVSQALAGGEDPETIRLQEENAAKAQPAVLGAENYNGSNTPTTTPENGKQNGKTPLIVGGAIILLILVIILASRMKKNQAVS